MTAYPQLVAGSHSSSPIRGRKDRQITSPSPQYILPSFARAAVVRLASPR